jgi:hypothetical protein
LLRAAPSPRRRVDARADRALWPTRSKHHIRPLPRGGAWPAGRRLSSAPARPCRWRALRLPAPVAETGSDMRRVASSQRRGGGRGRGDWARHRRLPRRGGAGRRVLVAAPRSSSRAVTSAAAWSATRRRSSSRWPPPSTPPARSSARRARCSNGRLGLAPDQYEPGGNLVPVPLAGVQLPGPRFTPPGRELLVIDTDGLETLCASPTRRWRTSAA